MRAVRACVCACVRRSRGFVCVGVCVTEGKARVSLVAASVHASWSWLPACTGPVKRARVLECPFVVVSRSLHP